MTDADPVRWTPALQRALLEHYDRSGRDLPWRTTSDPYRIWVSEVMLQQTRVKTVLPYYDRWMDRFPDLESLAVAELDDVLEAWAGLGYYSRARRLHGGARVVRERHGGQVPGEYEALRSLPGVGEYTAGAVASIAFQEAVPAVDGNARRVLARLFDLAAPTAAELKRRASELVDPARPGDWNQAVMELGATVCTPRRPRCHECPVSEWCGARAAGTQLERPPAKAKGRARRATFVAAVPAAEGRVMLERRPDQGLLAGLWSFAVREITGASRPASEAVDMVQGLGLQPVSAPTELPVVRHRFSHIDATYRPVLVPVAAALGGDSRRWIEPHEPGAVALPVAQRKIATLAADHGGQA